MGQLLRSPRISDSSRAQALAERFQEVFGREAEGVWAAPGRVNLIGEHTDYNAGLVLPFALPECTFVAAAPGTSKTLRVHSRNTAETVVVPVDSLRPGSPNGWAAYVAGTLWALDHAGYQVSGADLVLETGIPQGAGLSSSAALECSVGLAAAELYGHQIEPLELAKIAQRAENEYVGMPCGLMDQMVSMLGRANNLVQFDNRSLDVELVPFETVGTQILVIDTKAPHRLVEGEYAARRQQCEEAARRLGLASLREINDDGDRPLEDVLGALSEDLLRRRVRHVVTENQRVQKTVKALAVGNLGAVGEHLTASHVSLRDDFEVSSPEVDLAQQSLMTGGAYGARITGGGFGGCVIALMRSQDAQPLVEQVRAAFAARGYREPVGFVTAPAQGARRVI